MPKEEKNIKQKEDAKTYELIYAYLDENGCALKHSGYMILSRLIAFSMKYPQENVTKLCKRYVIYVDDRLTMAKIYEMDDRAWIKAYKAATYCYKQSKASINTSFVSFIRNGAIEVSRELSDKDDGTVSVKA